MVELPTSKVVATAVNPKTLLIYSLPKSGKTSIISQLDNCLILDLEKGTDYINAVKIQISNFKELKEVGDEIIKQGKPYKHIAIDTVTEFERWCEPIATMMYKKSTLGKNFTDASVLLLPNGAGYNWLRIAFNQWMDYVQTLADTIILVGHIKDKYLSETVQMQNGPIQVEKGGGGVSAFELDLTGKIKSMTCSRADAIGFLYSKTIVEQVNGSKTPKKRNVRILTFKGKNEVLCGSRVRRLENRDIIISEKLEDGTIITFWSEIFIPEIVPVELVVK